MIVLQRSNFMLSDTLLFNKSENGGDKNPLWRGEVFMEQIG
jgi:hypothetical protein